ncbi:phenylalanine--tRNA ligase subunit beta [Desulfovibrio sp. JY]|nr:phenylalanine--tRNA ligase subunit beta [Desulfovibrio sp. JY]
MLLSLAWLREFTPYEGTPQQLADRLTMLGLEIEEIKNPFEEIASVVVGKVLTCEAHPDSDHLSCCTVDVGGEAPLPIVCGAPNVAAGQHVPVAMVGVTLPGGLTIKKSKIRGQVSEGMICSESELGLAEERSGGILVLPESATVGWSLPDALGLDTCVLDVSITPNRADCLSVLGIAREVAMAFDLPLTLPEVSYPESGPNAATQVAIEIEDPQQCPVYRAKLVTGVTIGPSPDRIRWRLLAIGQRPISNIVDATNYVLFELGQPLHAFDRAKLAGNTVKVRNAVEGEKITTLDGQERLLTARDLLICDAEKPVALAGVMGGENSEMGSGSTEVLLECAVFRPGAIRKTARRLSLPSEASYRFERGVDQVGSVYAMHRAVSLMLETAGGTVLPGEAVAEPRPYTPRGIGFRPARASLLLGEEMAEDFCRKTLTALGCKLTDTDPSGAMAVTPPSYRLDLEREADLIEEVGRVYGLDRIAPKLPRVSKSLDDASPETEFGFWARLRAYAVGVGLREAVNYSFVGHGDLDLLCLDAACRVSVANPLSEDQNVMRPMLAPGLLGAVRHNLAQGNANLRLFEVARIFTADAASDSTAREAGRMGLALHGARHPEAWPWPKDVEAGYADIKGLVEGLLAHFHLPEPTFSRVEDQSWLAPQVDVTCGPVRLGLIGQVTPEVADAFHARSPLWIAELDIDALRVLVDAQKTVFAPLPGFPPVRRDITLAVPAGVTVGAVLAALRGANVPILEDVVLIDAYKPEGEVDRRLTFRITYRHPEKTLKDKEVDKVHEGLAKSVLAALPVTRP